MSKLFGALLVVSAIVYLALIGIDDIIAEVLK